MSEENKCNIRVKVLSIEGCEACEKEIQAAKEIVQEKGMGEEVQIFKVIADDDDSKIIEEFGKDVTAVPVTIVERQGEGGRSKKLIGFNKEELEEAIEDVRCK